MPTSPLRYRLAPPPNPTGAPFADGEVHDFHDLAGLATYIARLKWMWEQGQPTLARDNAEHRLVRWLHEPRLPEGVDNTAARSFVPFGLYVAGIDYHGVVGESCLWTEVPTLQRRVAELLPPKRVDVKGSSESKQQPGTPIVIEDKVVRAVVRAMLTRPLVLLAGISGSGKTQLARRLGLAWAAGVFGANDNEDAVIGKLEEDPKHSRRAWIGKSNDGWRTIPDFEVAGEEALNRFGFVAVQSDWTDASHLWGYHVPLPAEAEGFYGTEALRVFLSAQQGQPDHEKPHFLLLDEMNLSRPEHYASDLLSAMEVLDREVIQLHRAGDNVRLRAADGRASDLVPSRIAWPTGLLVIGTVNVDETTFSFAPKVLDRAALLEFTDVQLDKVYTSDLFNAHMPWFDALHTVCRPYNLHLGYRAAGEVLDALKMAPVASRPDVLDLQLRNKILPRVRGPRASVERLLVRLLRIAQALRLKDDQKKKLAAETSPAEHARILTDVLKTATETSGEVDALNHARKTYGPEATPVDPASVSASEAKIGEMLRRAYAVGFTSYFG